MDRRSLSEDAPESQWREPLRDKVGAEQLQQVHHCTTQPGGSDCGPEGQRSAPSGSRRAATGVRNNQRVCSETVEDHDRRFWHRWPLTWRSSHAFTVLNTAQFLAQRPSADLARRKSDPHPQDRMQRSGAVGMGTPQDAPHHPAAVCLPAYPPALGEPLDHLQPRSRFAVVVAWRHG
jgi:hypothetical protein